MVLTKDHGNVHGKKGPVWLDKVVQLTNVALNVAAKTDGVVYLEVKGFQVYNGIKMLIRNTQGDLELLKGRHTAGLATHLDSKSPQHHRDVRQYAKKDTGRQILVSQVTSAAERHLQHSRMEPLYVFHIGRMPRPAEGPLELQYVLSFQRRRQMIGG